MAENKFIERLQGKGTEKSVVEIKNTATPTMFTNMPAGDSNAFNTYSDHRGNATVVANGTMNWKVADTQTLTLASTVHGNGEDITGSESVSGAGLWIDAEYTFPSTGDLNHPVAMVFNPQTKWVLKLCGDNLLSPTSDTIEFTVLITFGVSNIISKTFTVAKQANKFCKEFVIDFAESNTNIIKAQGLSTMKLQLLCGTADASANIYGGMTVLTCLQRKVEAVAISSTFANVEEVLRDGLLPNDYFSNGAYIAQVTDGDTAFAVFQRDGDEMLFVGWHQPIPDQTGNSGKFLTTDGSLMSWAQITISDVDSLQTELSDLQDQIDDLSGRGRYLSIWNCTTGLAETNPPTSPYMYQSGDYFIVGTVGATNYKPDGASYTTGVASTTVETAEVKVDDVYLYDGTNWKLLASSQRTYTFGGIAGSPYDNTALGNALNGKVDETSTANQVYGTDNTGNQTTYTITQYLKNIATATDAISVYGTANTTWTNGINIGAGSRINSTNGIAIGVDASADVNAVGLGRDADAGVRGTAIGAYAKTSADTGIAIGCWNSAMHNAVSSAKGAYQFGVGTNNTARTLNVGWYNDSVTPSTFVNYQLLDGDTGLIPDARISTNIARTADIPTVNDATLTIQKNGTTVDTFTANSATNTTVNITVPTTPADIGAQSEITLNNMLDADLVDDSTSTNKFVTASDITTWNSKQDALTAGTNINITGTTISATDTTYTGSDGITLTGTNFTNSGVRAVASGTANGTISVNTNGTSADVAVTGLGSAAYTASTDYATSAQGGKADTAVQPADLATVATTGDYDDLLNKPTIPAAQVNSDWDAVSGVAQILNKPTLGTMAAENASDYTKTSGLATVATTGDYDDLLNKPTIPAAQVNSDWDAISGVAQILNKPTIPTVNDATINVTQNGVSVGSFTLNQASGDTIALTDTTYSVMTGASAGDAGASGLVPAPAAGDQAKFLQGDGTWANPTAATAWGNITGTLSDQTDLNNALAGKADTATTLAGYGITDGANTDLSNLTSTGQNIGNWSSNVTNCITEIPQDIKLELSSGTLTLKAGSKVYVPNGFEADGTTPKYNVINIASDISFSGTIGTATLQHTVWSLVADDTSFTSNVALGERGHGSTGSGTTTPSTATQYYNTNENIIHFSGTQTTRVTSFPLALITLTNGVLTNIEQVFNGFGYIGSTLFALPGVKGLIPNGRNADGTLNNTEWVCSSVVIKTYTTTEQDVTLGFDGSTFSKLGGTYSYNSNTNYNYNSNDLWPWTLIDAHVQLTSGVISHFNPKTAFHAVDYSDTEYMAHQAMPSYRYVNLTLGASGTTYTAPADGWFYLKKTAGTTSFVQLFRDASLIGVFNRTTVSTDKIDALLPCSKSDVITASYSATGATDVFRFYYANGAQ